LSLSLSLSLSHTLILVWPEQVEKYPDSEPRVEIQKLDLSDTVPEDQPVPQPEPECDEQTLESFCVTGSPSLASAGLPPALDSSSSDTDSDSHSDSEALTAEALDAHVARMRRRRERKRLWEAFGQINRHNSARRERERDRARLRQRREEEEATTSIRGDTTRVLTSIGGCKEDSHLPYRLVDGDTRSTDTGGMSVGICDGRGAEETHSPASKLVGALFAKASVRDWAPTTTVSSQDQPSHHQR
jgi:hypothetical protein